MKIRVIFRSCLPERVKGWIRYLFYFSALLCYRCAFNLLPRKMMCDQILAVQLVGCGRSGTTILADCLSKHSDIFYLFEPYHAWTAISRRFDALGMFIQEEGIKYALNWPTSSFCTEKDEIETDRVRKYFILGKLRSALNGKRIFFEKMPWNVFKSLGFLNHIPNCKIIGIFRHPDEVVRSITGISKRSSYQFGRSSRDQWWGFEERKRKVIHRLAQAYGLSVRDNSSIEYSAAVEWLISNLELIRVKEQSPDEVFLVNYESFIKSPAEVIEEICQFLNISNMYSDNDFTDINPPVNTLANRPTGNIFGADIELVEKRINEAWNQLITLSDI